MNFYISYLIALASLIALHFLRAPIAAENFRSTSGPRRIVIPELIGTIAVDGHLTEQVWRNAAVFKSFRTNDGKDKSIEATKAFLWYDNEALYFGSVSEDTDILATFKRRDSRLWEEEALELFITTGPRLDKYFELQWSPLGTIFDALIENRLNKQHMSQGIKRDWGYTARGMKSEVIVNGTVNNSNDRDVGWVVEVRLPFSDLQTERPEHGDMWRANIYRYNRRHTGFVQLVTWTPTLSGSVHEPSRFGRLIFESSTPRTTPTYNSTQNEKISIKAARQP